MVELIDVMPTVAELAGLPPPIVHPGDVPLDGISLAPLFAKNPPVAVKPYVLMQQPRCPTIANVSSQLWYRNLCINTPATQFGWMGYSLRNDEWRFNAWFRWNGTKLAPIIPSLSHTGAPSNGTDGFYSELYYYNSTQSAEDDLDALELIEMGSLRPDVVDTLYEQLLSALRNNSELS
jgi:hypothetical protein